MDNTIFAAETLKPALVSIRDACTYMGGVSRAKFYADILPKLETVRLGARHFVVVGSIDRFIASRANIEEQKDCRVPLSKAHAMGQVETPGSFSSAGAQSHARPPRSERDEQ